MLALGGGGVSANWDAGGRDGGETGMGGRAGGRTGEGRCTSLRRRDGCQGDGCVATGWQRGPPAEEPPPRRAEPGALPSLLPGCCVVRPGASALHSATNPRTGAAEGWGGGGLCATFGRHRVPKGRKGAERRGDGAAGAERRGLPPVAAHRGPRPLLVPKPREIRCSRRRLPRGDRGQSGGQERGHGGA